MSNQKNESQSEMNTNRNGGKQKNASQAQDWLVHDTQQLLAQNQNIAHRLNNQLGIIRGNLEMLSMELSPSGKSEQRLVNINGAIDAASDIVTLLHSHSDGLVSGKKKHSKPFRVGRTRLRCSNKRRDPRTDKT